MINRIRKHLRRKADPVELLQRLAPPDMPLRTLVHVGAHLAQELEQYESAGFQQIMWIEASPQIHSALQHRIEHSRGLAQHYTRCALATDQDGVEFRLREFSNDGMSNSIFSSTDHLRARWPGVMETGACEVVRSQTLDSILADTPFAEHCDLLVVDVQGAELLALQGAEKTLASAAAVVCEVSTVPYYDGGVLYAELADFLDSRGFVPTASPRRHGDMLFMRNRSSIRVAR